MIDVWCCTILQNILALSVIPIFPTCVLHETFTRNHQRWHVSSICLNKKYISPRHFGQFPLYILPIHFGVLSPPGLGVDLCVSSRSPVKGWIPWPRGPSLPLKAAHEGRVANFVRFNAGTSCGRFGCWLMANLRFTVAERISWFFFHNHATISLKWLWDGEE